VLPLSVLRMLADQESRVGKGALFAPCPPGAVLVGTLRFAHPTMLRMLADQTLVN